MEFSPQKLREMVFQFLFSFDMGGEPEGDLIALLMRELAVSKKQASIAHSKAKTIWQHREELDVIIARYSKEYSLDRIKTVERNVLRLAFYELLIEKALTPKIIISEAHRLTRKFSAVEGAAYVNAVLDSLKTGSESNESSFSPPEREVAT